MVIASAAETFIDFLGFSAKEYENHLNQKDAYQSDLCVYLLSADNPSATLSKVASSTDFTDLTEASLTAKYVFSNNSNYMCHRFDAAKILTDSDSEFDTPTCYEQLFDVPVSSNLLKSSMYGSLWAACSEATGSFGSSSPVLPNKSYSAYLQERFLISNNTNGLSSYAATDYYKYGISTDLIVHNRSYLAITDLIKSIHNGSHSPFNCMLFCINKNFDTATAASGPAGMNNAIPVCMSCLDGTNIVAGQQVELEPNLNGIVTTEV